MNESPDAAVLQRVALPFTGGRAVVKRYRPRLRLPPHSHDYAVLVLVLSGSFTEACADNVQMRLPGALRILGPGEVHSNDYGPNGAEALLLELPSTTLSVLTQGPVTVAGTLHFAPETWEARLACRIWEELRTGGTDAVVAIDALVLELLVRCARRSSQGDSERLPHWLTQVRELMREQFTRRLTIVDLAAAVAVHPVTLRRSFQRTFGQSPRAYLETLRLDHARWAIINTDHDIAAVAAASGFYDQAHLTRTFRRVLGVTPGHFRAKYAPECRTNGARTKLLPISNYSNRPPTPTGD